MLIKILNKNVSKNLPRNKYKAECPIRCNRELTLIIENFHGENDFTCGYIHLIILREVFSLCSSSKPKQRVYKVNELQNLARTRSQQCQRFSTWRQSLGDSKGWYYSQTSGPLLTSWSESNYREATCWQILALIKTIWNMYESYLYANWKKKPLTKTPSKCFNCFCQRHFTSHSWKPVWRWLYPSWQSTNSKIADSFQGRLACVKVFIQKYPGLEMPELTMTEQDTFTLDLQANNASF